MAVTVQPAVHKKTNKETLEEADTLFGGSPAGQRAVAPSPQAQSSQPQSSSLAQIYRKAQSLQAGARSDAAYRARQIEADRKLAEQMYCKDDEKFAQAAYGQDNAVVAGPSKPRVQQPTNAASSAGPSRASTAGNTHAARLVPAQQAVVRAPMVGSNAAGKAPVQQSTPPPAAAASTQARGNGPVQPVASTPAPVSAANSQPRGKAPVQTPRNAPSVAKSAVAQGKAPARDPVDPDCDLCANPTKPEGYLTTKCGHNVCGNCVRQMFQLSIRERSAFPPRCCQLNQDGQILLAAAKHLLGTNLAKTFEKKAIEYIMPNPTYCHQRSCAEFIPADSIDAVFKEGICPKCKVRTCTMCKQATHRGRACPPNKEKQFFDGYADKQGWKRCPKCKTTIEKMVGCNHITCVCKYEFCYKCYRPHGTCQCDQLELMELFPPGHKFWLLPQHEQQRYYYEVTGGQLRHEQPQQGALGREVDVPIRGARAAAVPNNGARAVAVANNAGRGVAAPSNAGRAVATPSNIGHTVAAPSDAERAIAAPSNAGRAVAALSNAGRIVAAPSNAGGTVAVPSNIGRTVAPPSNVGRAVAARNNRRRAGAAPNNGRRAVGVQNNGARTAGAQNRGGRAAGNNAVVGNQVVMGDQIVHGNNAVVGNQVVLGNQYILGGDQAVVGNQLVAGNQVVRGNGAGAGHRAGAANRAGAGNGSWGSSVYLSPDVLGGSARGGQQALQRRNTARRQPRGYGGWGMAGYGYGYEGSGYEPRPRGGAYVEEWEVNLRMRSWGSYY